MIDNLVAFAVTVTLLSVTPGTSMALMTQSVLRDGRRAVPPVVAVTVTGLCVHGVASVAGLSALVMRSATAFAVLRWLGAGYLVWLGGRALWAAVRAGRPAETVRPAERSVPARRVFRQAFLGNVLNPKAAGFYLTALPQFLDAGRPVTSTALLVAVHVGIVLCWLTLFGWLVGKGRRALLRARVRRWLQATTGALLIGLGARAALR
ncbi:LysE family translocator [Longispora sp. NPDC051575]|uniref:LysE family translocator n=1 Tax=Longispora sp. NPDC051575 TaxID=3154943 RepID=UPI00341A7E0D